jgi:hypothetical protein
MAPTSLPRCEGTRGLLEGVPADVRKHGAADDKCSDDESGKDTGPEAHAAKGNEQDVLLASKIDAGLVRQESLHSNSNQKASGPDERDSE